MTGRLYKSVFHLCSIRGRLKVNSKHHPLKLNFLASEIDQESHSDSCCLQFVKELRFIRRLVCLRHFQLNHHDFVNQQISPVLPNNDVFVTDLDWRLRLTAMPSLN